MEDPWFAASPYGLGRWPLPSSVELDDEFGLEVILWRYGSKAFYSMSSSWAGYARDFKTVFSTFLGFANEKVPAERIRNFARRWGVLPLRSYSGVRPTGGADGINTVEGWRYTAYAFRGALAWADALRSEELPSSRPIIDVNHFFDLYDLPAGPFLHEPAAERDRELEHADLRGERATMRARLKSSRRALAVCIEKVLRVSGARPSIHLASSDQWAPEIKLGGGSLLAALANELLVTLTGATVLCAGCARPIEPKRRSSKRRSFCDACRKLRVPKRMAEEDYRRRRDE